MLRRMTAGLFVALLSLGWPVPVLAAPPWQKQADAAQVREVVIQRGTGPDARVKLKLRDGSTVKGYIAEIHDVSFVVHHQKTHYPTVVQYDDVIVIRAGGPSPGAKMLVKVGLLVFLLVVIPIIAAKGTA